ncbi:LysR family transcriptional regulator [Burkholderia glumae]|uniref:LysR family transcriptional regulator n=1 Tax=Burkholderia glumae TaxID=337 RepID=UPI001295C4AF|nr:LysR family transcriptional regulator [Burkholderia glumae]MCM2551998.1 LysR family transcriptional regulator [Burkholderia glumae]NVE25032.1 LysR family transcriptional regulator [Burkholderia glumae]QGA41081.1 LysR family transcriptional regulator [Burkholderia glumae]
MELKHLVAFVALAEELHFGRAAGRLCIVQPALSMQIKALETALGVRLFDRDRHKVALSTAGSLFLPEARATLEQAARAAQVARLSAQGEIGTLRLGFVSSVLPKLLPTLIRTMHARYPRIALDLKDMPTPDQIAALQGGTLDFGIARLPVAASGLASRVVLEESFVVAVPASHALARQTQIEPAQLRGQPAFVLARRYAPGFFDALLVALGARGVTLDIARELGEYTTMLALVAAGLGIGLIPAEAAAAVPPNVVARPLALPSHRALLGLIWVEDGSALKHVFLDVVEQGTANGWAA